MGLEGEGEGLVVKLCPLDLPLLAALGLSGQLVQTFCSQ
jgi:hypothetical protein